MTDTIIFDLDGTLLNTLEDLTDSVNHTMEQYHLPVHTIEEIRTYVGNGAAKLIERAVPQGRDNSAYDEILDAFRSAGSGLCRPISADGDGGIRLDPAAGFLCKH